MMTFSQNENLIEFICRSNATETVSQLIDLFVRSLAHYGIDRLFIGKTYYDGNSGKKHVNVLVQFPPGNVRRGKEYLDELSECPGDLISLQSKTQKKTSAKARAKKIKSDEDRFTKACVAENKIILSIYRPFGGVISMVLSSSLKRTDWDKDAQHTIYALANQFMIVYEHLTDLRSTYREYKLAMFTLREREVLLWLARGKSKKEISSILGVSESAIKKHCESIFRKLEVDNLPLAIVKALQGGLIHPY